MVISMSGVGVPASTESALVAMVGRILAAHGHEISTASIRELADRTGPFDLPAAVSALRAAGFESAGGQLSPERVERAHCPLIAFTESGHPFVILDVPEPGTMRVSGLDGAREELVPVSRVAKTASDFAILARLRSAPERARRQKSWFSAVMRQERGLHLQVILAAAISNFLGLSTALFIMVVYDRVVPNQAIESLVALTIGVLIALGFDFLIRMLRSSFIDRAAVRSDGRMARMIFDRILALDPGQRRAQSGSMASVVREFDTLRDFFTSATLVAIVDLPFIFLFVWVIWMISGPLALVPLIAVPLVILAGAVIQPMLARISEDAMASAMSRQGVLIETLNGLETVQATGSGRLMRQRFEEASGAQSRMGLKSRILSQFAMTTASSVQQLAQVAIVFYGVFLIADGTVTMGALIAAVILSGRTLAPLGQLAAALARANAARQAWRGLDGLMSAGARAEEASVDAPVSRPVLAGRLTLRGVKYGFPGSRVPLIDGIDLTIAPGEKVAVVGRMGSGKSTLARLCAGLLRPDEGAVLLDGVDLRQLAPADLRRNVGVMLQDSWLFTGTLRENIRMGHADIPDARLLEVARIAGVEDFASRHERGYDLPIRERGEGLSGGQRQSVCLARALLHDPGLLILDEPTSAMDGETEAEILQRLAAWGRDRTILFVTHRSSLLRMADRVLVIDGGRVVRDTRPAVLFAERQGMTAHG